MFTNNVNVNYAVKAAEVTFIYVIRYLSVVRNYKVFTFNRVMECKAQNKESAVNMSKGVSCL